MVVIATIKGINIIDMRKIARIDTIDTIKIEEIDIEKAGIEAEIEAGVGVEGGVEVEVMIGIKVGIVTVTGISIRGVRKNVKNIAKIIKKENLTRLNHQKRRNQNQHH